LSFNNLLSQAAPLQIQRHPEWPVSNQKCSNVAGQRSCFSPLLPNALDLWVRGDPGNRNGVCKESTNGIQNLGFFRMGLDAVGIRSIQLLNNRSTPPDRILQSCPWYIVEDIAHLEDFVTIRAPVTAQPLARALRTCIYTRRAALTRSYFPLFSLIS
jgi:hypothetical protein